MEGIGNAIIDSKHVPTWFRDFGIEAAGTSQKPVLVLGIVVVTLLFGIGVGISVFKLGAPKYARMQNLRFLLSGAVFVIFGIIGGMTLENSPSSSALYSSLTAFFATALGYATLVALTGLAENRLAVFGRVFHLRQSQTKDSLNSARRNFLVGAGTTAIIGSVGGLIGRQLSNFQKSEASREEVSALLGTSGAERATTSPSQLLGRNFDNINGISSYITPNRSFYLIDTAINPPIIDHNNWSLKVKGMVDEELDIDFGELLDLGLVEEIVTLSCVSNSVGGNLVGNAKWRGVPLKTILDMAGVNPNAATQVVGRSHDNWTGGFPTQLVYEPDRVALVAIEMNGEPLPRSHGFPARLVVSGLYGYVSATKWLTEIEITSLDFDPYWIPRGWAKEGPVKTQSRIDVPRPNQKIPIGNTVIAGVAWAPYRGISKVEVQIGTLEQELGTNPRTNSAPWMEAELSSDLTDNSWRQWKLDWEAKEPDRYAITVRATDGDGNTQTIQRADPRPDGASGWDAIGIRVE